MAMHVCVNGVYAKFLYFPVSFGVNLQLLQKKSLKIKNKC